MLQCIRIRVKRAIGKAILHKLPICACVESPHYFTCTRLRSLYITYYPCFKCAAFLCARTPRNAAKHRDLPFITVEKIRFDDNACMSINAEKISDSI